MEDAELAAAKAKAEQAEMEANAVDGDSKLENIPMGELEQDASDFLNNQG